MADIKPGANLGEGNITPETGESIITMQRVLVLDSTKKPLMPCHPARARQLLKSGQAAVLRRQPFTLILVQAYPEAKSQPVELRVDPGSRTSGLCLAAQLARGWVVLWAANLHHRGLTVKKKLDQRRVVRRNRRSRKTRYRKARFLNRTRPQGWLPPSLLSRVGNVETWARRLAARSPISAIQVETVRFDTQLMDHPTISGVQYQQGELHGYEVREYLLQKWGRQCAYCGAQEVPLEVEHIIPKSRGGSNRVSNLTLACQPCNVAKNSQTAAEFGYPTIQVQARQPLKDAAAVNATRYEIGGRLKALGLPVGFWSGGRTKHNRIKQAYPKDHWLDAACVGETGLAVLIGSGLVPLQIKATGRQARQMCRVDRFGFPRTKPKHKRVVRGFQTGDLVKAVVAKGQAAGTHLGRVAVRASGSFRVGPVDGIGWKYCSLVQRADGYEYN